MRRRLFIILVSILFYNVVVFSSQAQPAMNPDGLHVDALHVDALHLPVPEVEANSPFQAPIPGVDTVPAESGSHESSRPRLTLWSLIQASGLIGYIIILLSLISVALMIEYALSIRRSILIPPNFAEDMLNLLLHGQAPIALQRCRHDSSTLAHILHAGMAQYEFGWDAVEQAAEDATAEQASRLYRKVEYLNMIGNIAPMLGLLGTVVGMVIAFQQMAAADGYGRAADLAEGIYLALITTIQGLLVAIPCLAAHSLFINRIATLISETTHVAEQVLQPIKKNLLRKRGNLSL